MNKARFVRFRYPGGHLISDETLDFANRSTLLSLDNGGGKSVLVQVMIALLVSRGALRNFGKRKFSTYFSSPVPTFIVQEWKLDGDAGYFEIGMMVRKVQKNTPADQEEGPEEKLDLYGFIAEYSGPCSYDIDHLSLIDTNQDVPAYLSFAKAREYLSSLSADPDQSFRLYHLNDSAKNREFHQRLEELGIDGGEWDQQRMFSLDESGLSEFARTNAKETTLVRNAFLPAVEQKIDDLANPGRNSRRQQQGHIEMLQNNAQKYLKLYLENKDQVHLRRIYDDFLQNLHEISLQTSQIAEESASRRHLLVQGKAWSMAVLHAIKDSEDRQISLAGEIEQAGGEVDALSHEILSQDYYRYEKEEMRLAGLLKAQKEEEAACKEARQNADYEIQVLELARECGELREVAAELVYWKTKLENAQNSEEETLRQITQTAGVLRRRLKAVMEEENSRKKQASEKADEARKILHALDEEQKELQHTLETCAAKSGSLQERIEEEKRIEEKFSSRFGISIDHTLSRYEDLPVFEALKIRLDQEEQEAQTRVSRAEAAAEALRQQEKEDLRRETALKVEQQIRTNALADCENRMQTMNEALELRKVLLSHLDLEMDALFDTDAVSRAIAGRSELLKDKIRTSTRLQQDYKKRIEQLQKGCTLELPQEMQSLMDELGFLQQTGASWLKESGMSAKAAQQLIDAHPFLPYSLILTKEQIHTLLDALKEKGITTWQPVPLLDRDSLNESFRKKQDGTSCQNPAFDGLRFFLCFDAALLDPEEIASRTAVFERRQNAERDHEVQIGMDQDALLSMKNRFEDHLFTRAAYEGAAAECESARHALQKNHQEQLDLTAAIAGCRQQLKQAVQHSVRARRTLQDCVQRSDEFRRVFQAYQNACQAYRQLLEIDEKRVQLLERRQELENERDVQKNRIEEGLEQVRQCERRLEKQQAEMQEYQNYPETADQPVPEHPEQLRSRFEALQKKLDEGQSQECSRQVRKLSASQMERKRQLAQLEKTYGIPASVYESCEYNVDRVQKLHAHRKALMKKLEHNQEEQQQCIADKSRIHTLIETTLAQISELPSSKEGPLPRQQTRTIDLIPLKKEALKTLKSLEKELRRTDQRKNALETLSARYEVLLKPYEQLLASQPGDMENEQDAEMDLSYASLDPGEMQNEADRLDVNLGNIASRIQLLRSRTAKLLREARDRIPAQVDVLHGMIAALESDLDDSDQIHRTLQDKQELLHLDIERMDTAMENLSENRRNLLNMLIDYLEQVHDQLGRIDLSTTVAFEGRSRKMLEIRRPDWTVNAAYYEARTSQMIADFEKLAEENSSGWPLRLAQQMSTAEMYNSVIGIEKIEVSTWKIEQTRQTRIRWNDLATISGGESFLCSFVVVAALANFRRREEGDLLSARRQSSVMIMDNPFAKTQSFHIVSALMKLCRSTRTQLIALSAVENPDIVNAFSNIYVLRQQKGFDGNIHVIPRRIKKPDSEEESEQEENISIEPVQVEVIERAKEN